MSTSIDTYRTGDMPKTPPPKSRTGKSKKKGQKGVVINTDVEGDMATHGLLENFDLEMESKEKQFRLHLQTVLAAFKLRQASEIARIPPKLLKMTVEDVEKHWGGNWAGTLGRMAAERQREEEVGVEEKEKALREEVKGKRKRAGTNNSSPERTNKNARKDGTPLKSRPASTIPSSASKRKLGKKAVPFVSANPIAKGPSSLPQNHIFNPILPDTPLRRMNPTDVLLSMNGSPVVNPLSKSTRERQTEASSSSLPPPIAKRQLPTAAPNQIIEEDGEEEQSDAETDEEASDDENDLPDADAYAARLLSQSQSQPNRSAPSRSTKPKRNPSLLWRESISGVPTTERDEGVDEVDRSGWATVVLPNKSEIEFDPLALDRVALNEELVKRGLSAKEREEVGKVVQAEVVKALQSKIQSWC